MDGRTDGRTDEGSLQSNHRQCPQRRSHFRTAPHSGNVRTPTPVFSPACVSHRCPVPLSYRSPSAPYPPRVRSRRSPNPSPNILAVCPALCRRYAARVGTKASRTPRRRKGVLRSQTRPGRKEWEAADGGRVRSRSKGHGEEAGNKRGGGRGLSWPPEQRTCEPFRR